MTTMRSITWTPVQTHTLINKMRKGTNGFQPDSIADVGVSCDHGTSPQPDQQNSLASKKDQTESTTDEYVYFMTSDPLSERAALSEARHELAEQSNYLAINNPSSNACNHHDYQYVPLN